MRFPLDTLTPAKIRIHMSASGTPGRNDITGGKVHPSDNRRLGEQCAPAMVGRSTIINILYYSRYHERPLTFPGRRALDGLESGSAIRLHELRDQRVAAT